LRFRSVLAALVAIGVGASAVGACDIAILEGTTGAGGEVGSVSSVTSSSGFASTSTGVGGGAPSGVAQACTTDTDCEPGLTCITDTDNDPVFGGGPAGGFCTTACNADADCPDPGDVCLQIDPSQPGRCTLGCTPGPAVDSVMDLFMSLETGKCLGRPDLRCDALKTGGGVCLPTCGEDAQCEDGRVCDPRLAVCVDQPSAGLPTGDLCVETVSPTPCAGVCVGFNSGVAMCSSPCVLGGADPLASDNCGGPKNGFCAFRPAPDGAGDTGYCTPSCSAQSDCPTPSFFCFSVPELTPTLYVGYCFGADTCPNGQSDCIAQNDATYVCTPTPTGSFCLDPAFPLGGTGGGDAGGGGSGGAGAGGADASGATSSSSSSGGAGPGGASPGDAGPGGASPDDAGPGDAGPMPP
jgi:hypothetical protein